MLQVLLVCGVVVAFAAIFSQIEPEHISIWEDIV